MSDVFTSMKRAAFCLLGLALLSACGSEPTGSTGNQILGRMLTNLAKPKAETGPRDISELSRAAISQVNFPLGLVTIPKTDGVSTVAIASAQGDDVIWVSGDRASLQFDGPVLFATRGIGNDMLTSETATAKSAIRSGRPQSYQRRFRHLDGVNQIVVTDVSCDLSVRSNVRLVVLERAYQTREFSERCTSPEGPEFVNKYWIGPDQTLWQTDQWIGEDAGNMIFQRLVL